MQCRMLYFCFLFKNVCQQNQNYELCSETIHSDCMCKSHLYGRIFNKSVWLPCWKIQHCGFSIRYDLHAGTTMGCWFTVPQHGKKVSWSLAWDAGLLVLIPSIGRLLPCVCVFFLACWCFWVRLTGGLGRPGSLLC